MRSDQRQEQRFQEKLNNQIFFTGTYCFPAHPLLSLFFPISP